MKIRRSLIVFIPFLCKGDFPCVILTLGRYYMVRIMIIRSYPTNNFDSKGNEWCMFDFQATGDEDIAVASKIAYEEINAVINASSGGNVFHNVIITFYILVCGLDFKIVVVTLK